MRQMTARILKSGAFRHKRSRRFRCWPGWRGNPAARPGGGLGPQLSARFRGKAGMAGLEAITRSWFSARQDGTGGVEQPPAGTDQPGRLVQQLVLNRHQISDARRGQPPAQFRLPPPGAGAGAGRIDKHRIEQARWLPMLQRQSFDDGGAGAWARFSSSSSASPRRSAGGDLARVPAWRRQGQRLAARARRQIQHAHAGLRAAEMRGDLRRFVLNSKAPDSNSGDWLQIARLARDADALGCVRRGRAGQTLFDQRGDDGVAIRFQRVDAQIGGRAGNEGRHFFRQAIAESAAQVAFQPVGIFAAHPIGRGRWRGGNRLLLGLRQRRRSRNRR